MSVEGIWTNEVYGAFGWENRGVFVFENGRILGGDNRQFTIGTYAMDGEHVKAQVVVHYYGPPRTVFGEAAESFSAEFEGDVGDGTIEGMYRRPDRPEFADFYRRFEAFLRDEVDAGELDRSGEYPRRVLDGLRNLGAFGMKIAKEYGGLGFTNVEYNRVMALINPKNILAKQQEAATGQ